MNAILLCVSRSRHVLEMIFKGMALLAGWSYFGVAFFIAFDSTTRKFFNFSTGATTEISGYLLAFGISWSLAYTLAERAHIRIDFLVNKMPLGLRVWMHLIALLSLVALMAVTCLSAINVIQETMLFNTHDLSALSIPMFWPQLLWAIGLFSLGIFSICLTLEVALLLAAGRPFEIEDIMRPRGSEDETQEAMRAVREGEQ